jgi:hypothetical protein
MGFKVFVLDRFGMIYAMMLYYNIRLVSLAATGHGRMLHVLPFCQRRRALLEQAWPSQLWFSISSRA